MQKAILSMLVVSVIVLGKCARNVGKDWNAISNYDTYEFSANSPIEPQNKLLVIIPTGRPGMWIEGVDEFLFCQSERPIIQVHRLCAQCQQVRCLASIFPAFRRLKKYSFFLEIREQVLGDRCGGFGTDFCDTRFEPTLRDQDGFLELSPNCRKISKLEYYWLRLPSWL